jgi:tetratricopeptide (TPR) repeat protein
MGNLAIVAHMRNDLDAAEPLYRRALDAYQAAGKERHPDYLSMLNNHAMLLQKRNDNDGAMSEFRKILEIRREVLTREHPDTLISMNNLADFLTTSGKPDEAEPLLREVLEVLTRMPDRGARSEAGAFANANLAELLAARGDKAGAERHYRAALDIAQAVWPAGHPTVLTIRERLDAVQGAGPNDPSPR